MMKIKYYNLKLKTNILPVQKNKQLSHNINPMFLNTYINIFRFII